MKSRIGRAVFGRSRSETGRRSFWRDQRGGVAIIFGLTAAVCIAMTGGAVDLGRAYLAKSRLQSAVDGAALAGASTYLREGRNVDAAKQRIQNFFAAYSDLPGATLTINFDPTTENWTVTANMTVDMPFLAVLEIPTFSSIETSSFEISVTAEATSKEGVGENSSFDDIEISIMLDTTGSMGEYDSNGVKKIDSMKAAATKLIDMLVDDRGSGRVKVALAPFAPTVEVEEGMLGTISGKPLTRTVTETREVCDLVCIDWNSRKRRCDEYKRTNCRNETTSRTQHLYRCVTERLGTEQYTDAPPASGAYIPPKSVKLNDGTRSDYAESLELAQSCTPDRAIVPLTADKATLKGAIATFKDDGSTAGWLGTTWAWYLLSPNWAALFPASSAPKAYGTSRLKKIAILMTDGEYNTMAGLSADSTTVSNNAKTACTNMKAKGIEIYTVGFMLDSALAKATLQSCASSAKHYYLAENGIQLETVFSAIAYKAVPLHLSQ